MLKLVRAADVLLIFCFLLLLPVFCHAQEFGQNKVRYRTFDFKVLKTKHFDIYYYPVEQDSVEQAARMAERWYARLSKLFQHQLSSRQPVILYANHPDFRGTTVIPGTIGETTGGVTEGLRRRVVLPMAGSMAETDHVLGHELVHAFQYDITTRYTRGSGMPGALQLPLWFIEGMAEYLSVGPVDSQTAMWMRDAVLRDDLPDIKKLDNPKYFPYRYGQALWAYIGGRYGDSVIGEILKATGPGGNINGAFKSVLHISEDDLSRDWKRSLAERDHPVLQAAVPAEKQAALLVKEKKEGGLNTSPSISPDGKWMMFYSERSLFAINLYLANAETGEIKREITKTAIDPHFDSFEFVNSAGAWSADSQRFAFGSIRSGKAELAIYDLKRNDVVKRVPLPGIGEVFSPSWSPDSSQVAFSAMKGGVTDLFTVDLKSGTVSQLTDDPYTNLEPAWSPDGKSIAFVTDQFTSDLNDLSFGQYRLAIMDAASRQIREVKTFDSGKNINPQWSADGNSLFFISDRDGIPNIYRVSLASGDIRQITNQQTGVSGIANLSPAFSLAPAGNRMVFSVFSNSGYSIYALNGADKLAGSSPGTKITPLFAGVLPPREGATGEVAAALQDSQTGLAPVSAFTTTNYHPSLSLDYVAPPSFGVGMSNFGTLIGGGTALYFSDLLGYHNLMTAFETSTTSQASHLLRNLSAIGAYQNQKHRWTWGVVGGQVPFLTGSLGQSLGTTPSGTPVVADQSITLWQIDREASGILAYPFNRAQRIEFSGGYQQIAFAAEAQTTVFSAIDGSLLLDQKEDIPAPDSLNLAVGSAALVYDTSIFGGTSPIVGQRYRLEAGVSGGSLDYSTILLDYRKYVRPFKHLTLAGRLLQYGRYGGDAEDNRINDIFVGYPALVRGYEPNSFSPAECGPPTQSGCQVFNQLFGSRIAVGNAEARVPILGPLGVIPSREVPPVEIAPFYDFGIAWTSADVARARGVARKPVSSYGASLRFNILGFAIGQLSYVRPQDRPLKNHVWEFSFLPGF